MVDIKLGLPCMVPDLVYKLERFVIRELKLTSRNQMRDGWTDGWGEERDRLLAVFEQV
jgi:hypothetical protein